MRFPSERIRLSQWHREIAQKAKAGGPIAISRDAARFLVSDLKKAEDRLLALEEALEAAESHPAIVKPVGEHPAIGSATETSSSTITAPHPPPRTETRRQMEDGRSDAL